MLNPFEAKVHKGHYEAGIKHYLKALQINPNYVEANNNLGVSLILKYIPAQQNLEKVLKRK